MGLRRGLAAEMARRGGVAALIWCAPLFGGSPLMAESGPPAGIWEFSLDDVAAKCRISLRPEASSSGGQVTIPIACLRAFPVLGPVESWTKSGDERLAFLGRTGQAVLNFAAAAGVYVAVGPAGETYRLTALNSAAAGQAPHGGEEKTPAPLPAPGAKARPQPAVAAADAGGRYSILRDGGKDTGCMLTLDAKGKGQATGKATLAPGCRDQGLVVFDPAAWEIARGQLVLIARKGHKTHLDAQPDGSWKKDPAEGKPLSLKKL